MTTNAEIVGGIPQVSLIGTPRGIGEALGQRLKPRLQVLSEYLIEQLASAGRLGTAAIRDRIRTATAGLARLEPSLVMELESIARAAELPLEQILAIHGYADLLGFFGAPVPATPSTFIALPGDRTRTLTPQAILVWEADPILIPYVSLVHRIPAHGPASLSLTLAGLHPLICVTEAGLAIAGNAMHVADGDPEGHFTTHLIAAMTTCPGFEDAVHLAQKAPRWGGRAIHVLAANGNRASIEVSGRRSAVLPDQIKSVTRVHTNHPLAAELRDVAISDETSRFRLETIAAQVVRSNSVVPEDVLEWFGLSRTPTPPASTSTTTRRRRGHVANPDSCITVVADPVERSMWVRRGRGTQLEHKKL